MALFRISRDSRRFQSSASSISFAQSILLHIPPEQPNPNYTARSFTNNFFNFYKFYDHYTPKPHGKFNFRAFDSYKLGYNAGLSTWAGENKEEDKEKVAASAASSIDLYLPGKARPYAHLARLGKPIGTWLLDHLSDVNFDQEEHTWSITLAASPGSLPDIKMMTLFGCGDFLLRGAGCTINDLLDRDIDTKVECTRLRPIASDALTPFEGLCFLGVQLSLGLGILLQLNCYRGFIPTVGLYLSPPHEEANLLVHPQAFQLGSFIGMDCNQRNLDPAVVLPLYLSGVCWTLVYDTIYAHQDKEDDLKVGVKSTALRFGDSTKEWVGCFGILCISTLALSGFNADIGWPYYAFLTAASGQLAWQIWTVDLSCQADCNRKFVSNNWFGTIVFNGILFGRLMS